MITIGYVVMILSLIIADVVISYNTPYTLVFLILALLYIKPMFIERFGDEQDKLLQESAEAIRVEGIAKYIFTIFCIMIIIETILKTLLGEH